MQAEPEVAGCAVHRHAGRFTSANIAGQVLVDQGIALRVIGQEMMVAVNPDLIVISRRAANGR